MANSKSWAHGWHLCGWTLERRRIRVARVCLTESIWCWRIHINNFIRVIEHSIRKAQRRTSKCRTIHWAFTCATIPTIWDPRHCSYSHSCHYLSRKTEKRLEMGRCVVLGRDWIAIEFSQHPAGRGTFSPRRTWNIVSSYFSLKMTMNLRHRRQPPRTLCPAFIENLLIFVYFSFSEFAESTRVVGCANVGVRVTSAMVRQTKIRCMNDTEIRRRRKSNNDENP